MTADLVKYLLHRPIASILEKSTEKNDLKALKVMCVIDFEMDKRGYYVQMEKHHKLKEQLLNFHSFGSLQFYDCRVNAGIGSRVLQCKFCELIGM